MELYLGRGVLQMGSENVDMYYRILKKGYKIVYEPNSSIYHNHRHTQKELIDYAYSCGVSIVSFTKKYFKKDPYVFALYTGNLLLTTFWLLRSIIEANPYLKVISLA
jgi:GT2 family glycosyltransferase